MPDCQIPNNSRVGSFSVHFAILAKFGTSPGISGNPTKLVFALIREPLARYRSALSKNINDKALGNHFDPQVDLLLGPEVRLYKFPEHLEQFGNDTGLGKIPWVNKTSALPALSEEQIQKTLETYAKDAELYAGIKQPGQRYVP